MWPSGSVNKKLWRLASFKLSIPVPDYELCEDYSDTIHFCVLVGVELLTSDYFGFLFTREAEKHRKSWGVYVFSRCSEVNLMSCDNPAT